MIPGVGAGGRGGFNSRLHSLELYGRALRPLEAVRAAAAAATLGPTV